MPHDTLFPKTVALSAVLLGIAAPASAQATSQCETMMMVGTQNYTPAAVAGCTAYFQALADGALAPGTFAASRGMVTTVSTSGIGG